jgi:hypothetical protein
MWNKELDKKLLSYEGGSIGKNLVSYCEGEGFDLFATYVPLWENKVICN